MKTVVLLACQPLRNLTLFIYSVASPPPSSPARGEQVARLTHLLPLGLLFTPLPKSHSFLYLLTFCFSDIPKVQLLPPNSKGRNSRVRPNLVFKPSGAINYLDSPEYLSSVSLCFSVYKMGIIKLYMTFVKKK